jgi:hypothetical protein
MDDTAIKAGSQVSSLLPQSDSSGMKRNVKKRNKTRKIMDEIITTERKKSDDKK